jgi:deoxyuridine 5'-triphosphate nucleotidohydrolase
VVEMKKKTTTTTTMKTASLTLPSPDGRVAPRSGLAAKHGIDTMAGVIDADYRGPVGVILANLSDVDFEVKVGDRIAQLIVEKVSCVFTRGFP